MRHLAVLTVALGLGVSTIGAQAMPFPTDPLKSENLTTLVRYNCGPGWTRGPYGHCRPRYTCPVGWHPGPFGWHCFRN